MKFASEQEYLDWRARVFEFLWNEVAPRVDDIEAGKEDPADTLFARFREYDLWGLIIPTEYGGIGLDTTHYLPFLAEFAKIGGVIRVILHVHATSARAVAHYGTDEQKQRYLPRLATGESSMTLAITEPRTGSGVDVAMAGVRDGDRWVVNGQKHYITNADFADLHLLLTRTDPAGGRRGFSALVTESSAEGFSVEDMPHMMGNNGPPHGILSYNDVRVPIDDMVGAEGDGLGVFLGELEPSRVFVAASSLGTAERCLEMALDFAKQRITFGKPIAERESIKALLADMAKDIYGLKLMLEDVADKLDQGVPCSLEASIVKLHGLEVVMRVTDLAMEILGGRAYFSNYPYPFERLYREARLNALEEGTPSIQKLVIARDLLRSDLPLAAGTLGDTSSHPAGVNPALGELAPHDLTYAHDHGA